MRSQKTTVALATVILVGSSLAGLQKPAWAGPFESALDERPAGNMSDQGLAWPEHRPGRGLAEDRLPEPSTLDPAPSAGRATFSVGNDAACDFATLAEALSSPLVGDGDVLNLRSDLNPVGSFQILNRSGSLTLRGGFASCSEVTPTGLTTFNGNGSRVFYLETGTSFSGPRMVINLERLEITGGETSGSFGGGGLMVNGRPGAIEVNLRRVSVSQNSATQNGGGISVRVNGENQGSGAQPAMLTLDNDSILAQNTAGQDGGGLNCFSPGIASGSTVVRLGTVFVAANQAVNGGGIAINGCANVLLYPGISLRGITSNTASGFGGGVYVRGDGARVRILGSTFEEWGDAGNGGYLGGNTAQRGGGIYARDDSYVDTRDMHLVNNTATVEGGAVAVDQGPALVLLERHNPTAPCQSGSGLLSLERCSEVRGNSGGNAGGAFSARNGGQIEAVRTRVFNNSSDVAAIAATSGTDPGNIRLVSVVAWGNQSAWGVASNNGLIELHWSTFADNNTTDAFIRVAASGSSSARVNIYGSILRESGLTAEINGPTANNQLVFDCVIGWQDASNFPGSKVFYRNLDPQFVNPAVRDYRQGPISPAIDFCDGVPGPPPNRDFDGRSRGLTHIGDPITPGGAGQGPYDLGAFEPRWRTDRLFDDRFEQN